MSQIDNNNNNNNKRFIYPGVKSISIYKNAGLD